MRNITVFICVLFFTNVNGQTKQDTLTILKSRAMDYLNQMYTNQNFDSASTNWYDSVLLDVEEIYKQKGNIISDKTHLKKQLKEDYRIFFASYTDFSIIGFDSEDMSDDSKIPMAYFKYSFNEKANHKDLAKSSYLYFIFDTNLSKWRIWDFRISEILGDPTRWLK